jgi:Protein of unknown function (DUF2971)
VVLPLFWDMGGYRGYLFAIAKNGRARRQLLLFYRPFTIRGILRQKEKEFAMFKYMSEKVAALFAKTIKVRFTQPFDLNDPFEFRPFMDFEGTADDVRPLVDAKITEMFGTLDGAFDIMAKLQATDPNYPKLVAPIEVMRKLIAANPALEKQFMEEMQKHKATVLDNKRMAIQWEAQWEKFRQALGQALGIFSLTEDPANVLMWSHYASQSFGVAVELDEGHPWFDQRTSSSDDIRHLVHVSYVQDPHPRTWKQISGTDMLYTKNSDWSYEREWRIIRPLKDGTDVGGGVVCFDVAPNAIRSFVFGSRTTAALEQEIRASAASNAALSHVSFRRARLVGGGKIEIVGTNS